MEDIVVAERTREASSLGELLHFCSLCCAEDGDVELKEYDASAEGIILSYTENGGRSNVYDNTLESLWEKDRHFWK